jgi:hypothetical protein
LSLLESQMAINANAKSFPGSDAENDIPEQEQPSDGQRKIYGIIKLFVSNVHHCKIVIQCKLISGTVEVHNCSHLSLEIQSEATVATLQLDLSQHIQLDFKDAASGKNTGLPGHKKVVRTCIYYG